MNIKRCALFVMVLAMLAGAGCKDDSEVVCENGVCRPTGLAQDVVEVDMPSARRSLPELTEMDEPVNQEFSPIRESQLADNDIMTMAGNEGQFNEVILNDIDIPGVGHTEAAVYGDAYIEKEYRDNLWPGGIEQSAEMDFDEF